MATSDPKSGLNILLADDNRDAADTLAFLLEEWGYKVRVAYDGARALQAALDDTPDCLISDINMPGLDGYSLARRIRAEPALAGVKLVAVSGLSDDVHAQAVHEAGYDYRLVKPADPNDLRELLTMMEQLKQLARQNVELAGETRDLIKEVKKDVKDVKQEVKELKNEVEKLKQDRDTDPGEKPTES